jgi:transcriptional regulator with GAF, ATPase, and Fis domain
MTLLEPMENDARKPVVRVSDADEFEQRELRRDSSPASIADIARSLSAEPTVLTTLQRIVDTAAETVEGCDGAGVLLVDKRKIVVGAWSNELVHGVEKMEYEVGEGPCVDAIWKRPTFESQDLRDETSLWPMFAERALAAGIESMLAFRLFASEETLGALDLYSGRRGAFDDSARAFGTVFAALAALALAGAQIHERDLTTAIGLREALTTRDVIGQAKGILMVTRHVDADGAFELLRATSERRNEKVRLIAEHVISTGDLPS